MVVKGRSKSNAAQEDILSPERDSENDSDAPEEESNVNTSYNIKNMDKNRKSKKRSMAKPVSSDKSKDIGNTDIEMDTIVSSEEASTSTAVATSSTSHILDPSLFAASFAKKDTNDSTSKGKAAKATLSNASSSKLPTKKQFGLGKCRDGQPMKKLKDGRTIVRVLPKQPKKIDLQKVDDHALEETLFRPSALDSSEVVPNAKIRSFKKQKLGLKERKLEPAVKGNNSRLEEDPLGLEDPAFMKGGELEGVGLSLSRKPTMKSRPVVQRKGGRTKFTPSMSKHGQALQFARSI